MSNDGYGRLQSKHVPEQNVGTATVYAYNPDDTLQSVTDARGATATYGYNNRHQVTSATHILAGQNTIAFSYGYDAAGNRTSMTDPLGNKSYSYNQLSQLMSETRTFDVGSFTLSYDYNLAGELKKITDATNMTINYDFDNAGRLSSVTGSDTLYANVSNYASNFQYRAWGGLKAITDGTSHSSNVGYNSRLQVNHFEISGSVANQNYDYYNDGRINYVHNTTDISFDRSYSYDHAGRLSAASSGGVARGEPTQTQTPYQEIFGYDAFSNLNYRYTGAASQFNSYNYSTYTNNRHNDWGYDADGRNTNLDGRGYTFDAAGQMTSMAGNMYTGSNYISATMNESYDGDGAKAKEISSDTATATTYYLISSVLGGAIVEEMDGSGQKQVGYIYAAGQLLAQQANNAVTWKHNNPVGTSQYNTLTASNWNRTEVDPLGADVTTPIPPPPDNFGELDRYRQFVAAGIKQGHCEEFYAADEGRILGTEEFIDATIYRIGEPKRQILGPTKATEFRPDRLITVVEKICRVSREEFCGGSKSTAAVTAKEMLILNGLQLGARRRMLAEITASAVHL